MRLITELNENIEYVTEDAGYMKKHYIQGQFISTDSKNRNGRIYPMENIEGEVERYIVEMVKSGRALSELGHPNGPTVNLEKVSHRITELHKNDKGFSGKALIVETPCGQIMKGLLESGAKIGVSTRGLGSLKESNGCMEVQKDF